MIVDEKKEQVFSTELSQKRLKEYLEYDPETGIFIWIKSTNGSVKVGSIAGSEDSKGYIKIPILGHRHGAHQLAWLYMHGTLTMIDHKNNVPSDNRITNLRPATYSQNNHRKFIHNPTGFRGIRFRNGFYEAHIRINGVITRLGKFNTAEEASGAYEQASKEHYGEFARETEARELD